MKISVIVSVYNSELSVKKCINSILSQSLTGIELILVDDGSTDGTAAILDEISHMENVNVYHLQHFGLAQCRNFGLEVASGEYIGFVDADDYIDRDMYKIMYESISQNQADFLFSSWIEEDLNGSVTARGKTPRLMLDHDEIINISTSKGKQPFFWFVWKGLYSRKFLVDNRLLFSDGILGEDTVFNIEAALNAKQVCCIDDALYHYVQNPNSLMRRKHKKGFIDMINGNYVKKVEIYEKYHIPNYMDAIADYALNHSVLMLLGNELHYPRTFTDKYRHYKMIRSCEMSQDAFHNSKIQVKSIKQRILVILLKYKQYWLLTLIDLWTR